MSVVLAVATGLVGTEHMAPGDFRRLRKAVRAELRDAGLHMQSTGDDWHMLRMRTKKGGHKREAIIASGPLVLCCALALPFIPAAQGTNQEDNP
jgi:hypothetical protein